MYTCNRQITQLLTKVGAESATESKHIWGIDIHIDIPDKCFNHELLYDDDSNSNHNACFVQRLVVQHLLELV